MTLGPDPLGTVQRMPRRPGPAGSGRAAVADAISVLVVEDDDAQRAALVAALEVRGYEPTAASDARSALQLARRTDSRLALVDLGLPDRDGAALCRDLIEELGMSVVVVSADHDDDRIVEVLDLGAEDYVVKPYHPDVLAARLRRARRAAPLGGTLSFGDISVEVPDRVVAVQGERLRLQRMQFAVTVELVRGAGRIVTTKELAAAARAATGAATTTEGLRTCISAVRRQLRSASSSVTIRSESRVGYRMVLGAD